MANFVKSLRIIQRKYKYSAVACVFKKFAWGSVEYYCRS